jgi:protein phosphatase
VASRETSLFFLTHLRSAFEKEKIEILSPDEAMMLMRLAFIEANHFVYQLSQTHELLRGMGTTLVALYFHEDSCIVGHVGDSRIYRMREGHLEQLTHDHCHNTCREPSIINPMSCSWRKDEPKGKNGITRAIGIEAFVEPTVEVCKVQAQDLYLLCSDGLTDLVPQEEISEILRAPLTVEEKVRSLISSAKRKGGHDNITVICVEVR